MGRNKMENKKKCTKCLENKNINLFSSRMSGGKKRLRSICNQCKCKEEIQRRIKKFGTSNNPKHVKASQKKYSLMRKNGEQTERWIWEDSRKSDKKKGLENNLTKDFIKNQIEKGCSYCGESSIRMTLDRIDNSKGHTEDNVVPACIRCNYVRRNMPYEAWVVVAKGMKEAREKNLFNDWTGRIK